uniref:Uncharacterized protein n=1 Tax=Rhizophora mucronata TaxID=61149 RepID=A0A2P2NM73_RHIMU
MWTIIARLIRVLLTSTVLFP